MNLDKAEDFVELSKETKCMYWQTRRLFDVILTMYCQIKNGAYKAFFVHVIRQHSHSDTLNTDKGKYIDCYLASCKNIEHKKAIVR